MRCHSWKNLPVYRVQFFQDGRGKKFFHRNSEFRIPAATSEHNGSYFCRGMIQDRRNESSEAVRVIVRGERGAARGGPARGASEATSLSEPRFL